jgi:hypothetical protein
MLIHSCAQCMLLDSGYMVTKWWTVNRDKHLTANNVQCFTYYNVTQLYRYLKI